MQRRIFLKAALGVAVAPLLPLSAENPVAVIYPRPFLQGMWVGMEGANVEVIKAFAPQTYVPESLGSGRIEAIDLDTGALVCSRTPREPAANRERNQN